MIMTTVPALPWKTWPERQKEARQQSQQEVVDEVSLTDTVPPITTVNLNGIEYTINEASDIDARARGWTPTHARLRFSKIGAAGYGEYLAPAFARLGLTGHLNEDTRSGYVDVPVADIERVVDIITAFGHLGEVTEFAMEPQG